MDKESPQLVAGLGAYAAIVVVAALVPLRDWLGSTNAAPILAVVVVGAAIFGGRVAGGAHVDRRRSSRSTSFTRSPTPRLRINKREDIIAAGLLLVMGVAVGQLGDLALRPPTGADARVSRQGRCLRFEDVTAVVAAGANIDEVWPVVRQALLGEQLDLAELPF